MHKNRPEGKCKLQNSNRAIEECMGVGGTAQWEDSSTPSLGDRNMLQTAYILLNFL